jgi:cell division protein FtsQ
MERDIQNKPTTTWVIVLVTFAMILTIRLILTVIADVEYFPINSLTIKSSYNYLSKKQIQEILMPYMSKSYLVFSEKNVTRDIKKNPWVERVKVEKIWPDRVVVRISERFPVAFWNDMLLSDKGDLFMPAQMKSVSNLPYLYGPKDQQKDILQIYEKLSKLLKAQDLYIAKLWLHKNQSCVIALSNGVTIRLGKTNLLSRLERFCKVYPKLFAASFDQVSSIDLRYSKGIAVKWRKQNDQINSNPKT